MQANRSCTPLSSGFAKSSIAIENEASFAQSDPLSGDYAG
jgi:hypothetical protein